MLAAENWCIKVDDKVYGPYTTELMRKYAHEGRLASWSLIAPAGSRAWCEARKESTFSTFFGYRPVAAKQPTGPIFGRRDVANDEQANGHESTSDVRIANFVVVFDVVSASASRVEAVILSLGPAFRLADNVWNLTCELTAIGVRNAIAPYLNPRELIFVIDATRGRSSWQNYTPEAHAKIAAAYMSTRSAERVNQH